MPSFSGQSLVFFKFGTVGSLDEGIENEIRESKEKIVDLPVRSCFILQDFKIFN